MEMVKMLVHIPRPIKKRLDDLRSKGTTASGLIRYLLHQHFRSPKAAKKGR